MKKEVKKVTLEDLARMVQDGFSETSDELGTIRSDIRDIKGTLGPLVRTIARQDEEVHELRRRISYIEIKTGIEHK